MPLKQLGVLFFPSEKIRCICWSEWNSVFQSFPSVCLPHYRVDIVGSAPPFWCCADMKVIEMHLAHKEIRPLLKQAQDPSEREWNCIQGCNVAQAELQTKRRNVVKINKKHGT